MFILLIIVGCACVY
ncbi:sporulation protein YjcZ [Ectobacillus panaciterrae]